MTYIPAVIPRIPHVHRWCLHSCTGPELLLTDQVAQQHLCFSSSCQGKKRRSLCELLRLRQQDTFLSVGAEWRPAADFFSALGCKMFSFSGLLRISLHRLRYWSVWFILSLFATKYLLREIDIHTWLDILLTTLTAATVSLWLFTSTSPEK